MGGHKLFAKKAGSILFFICIMIFLIAPTSEAEVKTVRVGFFGFDGYHTMDKEGNRSGYGYEYLQHIAKYTDFIYEYVGYDKSWEEMQNMLEEGKIDILTSAQKTEKRLKRFDFSKESIGISTAILSVKAGNTRYLTSHYDKLDGIRVGMLRGNSRNKSLTEFAKENDFTYKSVYFDSNDELEEALQKGKQIDAIITSNLRKIRNEWTVAAFDPSPFYIMVQKGNHELLEEINQAIKQIQMDYPDLQMKLLSKYYSAENGDEISYTVEERKFIHQFNVNNRKVKVLINPDRAPLSYFKDGKAEGIIPKIAKEIFERAGLDYEIIYCDSRQDYCEKIDQKDISVRFDSRYDFNESERNGYKLTEPYMESTISNLTLRNFSGKKRTVAALKYSDITEKYIKKMYDENHITYYNTVDECVNAVLTGKQDTLYCYTYMAQQLVYKDVRNRLKEMLVPNIHIQFTVAVRNTENPFLFSILNKAELSLSKEKINQILQSETTKDLRSYSFIGYLYNRPFVMAIFIILIAVILFLLMLYFFHIKKRKLEFERVKEFKRFITYVCRVNDNVIEVDLEKHTCFYYEIKDGVIVREEEEPCTKNMLKDMIYQDDWEKAASITSEQRIEELIERTEEAYFECRIKEEHNQYAWFSFSFQGMQKDEEHPKSLMIFMKNIDKTKREEEQKKQALKDALVSAKRASEAKGVFMSRMSHEIRTPLNAIIGYLSIAQVSLEETEKAQDCLVKSEFAAHHLLNIINDVLDISAIESGRMKLAHDPFNLRQVLAGITSIFYTQAKEKNVKFDVELRDLTEESLIGDPLRLNQILMNLLSNAVKFTSRDGTVTLTIVQKAIIDYRVHLQMKIADTGIGISEEYKERMFTPFEQQDTSTARKFGGSGLGLSITKNLIMMMNGTIDMESKEGEGTEFTVGLSFDIDGTVEKKSLYDFSDLCILIVYAQTAEYESICDLLKRFGVKNDIVFDVEEAVKRVQEKKSKNCQYDLCLIDWNLVGTKGTEIVKQIQETRMGEKPIIGAAVFDYSEIPEELEKLDSVQVILKPLFQSSIFDWLVSNYKNQSSPKEKVISNQTVNLEGARVLLAEDNEMNMEIAIEILSEMGLHIDGAADGKEALETFEQSEDGTYQAILMDIQMPIMDGYEASRRIRACHHSQAKTIPIIALTADAFAEDVNRALATGMNDHVSKPIDFHILCDVLQKYICS